MSVCEKTFKQIKIKQNLKGQKGLFFRNIAFVLSYPFVLSKIRITLILKNTPKGVFFIKQNLKMQFLMS
jgi:hypothetical protein